MSVEKPWGGRFAVSTAAAMEAFSSSLAEDAHLVAHDVAGSIAHAKGLARAGLLTEKESEDLVRGLRAVHADLAAGRSTLKVELEDVHMNVETLLAAKTPLAARLHTGRSRNDQVALDLRLFARAGALELALALSDLADALLAQAAAHADVPVPGYTHVQPAQPVTFGHVFHAHALRFLRDADRALSVFDRANVSPLGAGALAGTSFALDPAYVADLLGMDGAFENSLDAVSDRDFLAGATYAAAMAGAHLSGLGEEWVLWTSPGFGFLTLPEDYTTGSSMMPQKRNPDAAELLRGRSGRLAGDLVSVLSTLKGLPLAYNRDLQEAKAPLVHALPAAVEMARIAAACARGLVVRAEAARAALSRGHLEATDLADWMVTQGVPFREAHHATGKLVALAEMRGVALAKLALDDFRAVWPGFTAEVFTVLNPATAPARRSSPGGTAPARVAAAVAKSRKDLERLREGILARGRKVHKERTLLGDEA
ncbi:MAG TPA: argininosuccinate lyase [Candidatus Thermoplasmatota archaeon]|nr:argininosuccinate lyase [Candidatus Thermoplasmatota archaeon]